MPQYRRGLWKQIFECEESKGLFTPLREDKEVFSMHMTMEEISHRVDTKSYIASLAPDERQRVIKEVLQLLKEHIPEGERFRRDVDGGKSEPVIRFQHTCDWYLYRKV